MAKAEAKGQRVKSFKYYVPQPDLSKTEEQIVVYLKADNGRFHIYQGQHMLEACREAAQKYHDTRSLIFSDNSMSSPLLDSVVKGFQELCTIYERLLREQKKERVIRFRFKRNLRAGEFAAKADISFCGAPAIHFDYEILWHVQGKLFRQHRPQDALQYAGEVKDRHDEGACSVIPWTQEREDFFANMVGALVGMIARVEAFQDDLVGNVDRMIAGGGALLLAPPARPGG